MFFYFFIGLIDFIFRLERGILELNVIVVKIVVIFLFLVFMIYVLLDVKFVFLIGLYFCVLFILREENLFLVVFFGFLNFCKIFDKRFIILYKSVSIVKIISILIIVILSLRINFWFKVEYFIFFFIFLFRKFFMIFFLLYI